MPWWLRDSQDEIETIEPASTNDASFRDEQPEPEPKPTRDRTPKRDGSARDDSARDGAPRSRRRRRRGPASSKPRDASTHDSSQPSRPDDTRRRHEPETREAKRREPRKPQPRKPQPRKPQPRKPQPRKPQPERHEPKAKTHQAKQPVRKNPEAEPAQTSQRADVPRRPQEPAEPTATPRVVAWPERNLPKDLIYAVPESRVALNDERRIAVFVDLENVALGVRDTKDMHAFEVNLVLERLLEKGKIIAKKAYADWERYSEFKRPFHLAAIELIDIPQKRYSGKNSADIKMVVDAMDLCYSKEHVDTFVLVSGDSDFSPLVSKLKENDKYVIGIGVKNSSSDLLVDNCDEFIYYEDVWRDADSTPNLDDVPKKEAEAFKLMNDAIVALNRENKDVIWGSMVKQTMKRKRPSFNEGYHGYSTFSELLEDAEKRGMIGLSKDQRSGNYIITEFAAKPSSKRRGAKAKTEAEPRRDDAPEEQGDGRDGERGRGGNGGGRRGRRSRRR